MVLPAKVFEIKEDFNMLFAAQKLRGFREEEPYTTVSGETINLVSEIIDLKIEGDTISGIFSRDFIRSRVYRRRIVETPVTEESPFWIKRFGNRFFLIVLAPSTARGLKKLLTNYVANKLSRVLFIKPNVILEVEIPHEHLKALHESNPQATKLIWFDNVDIPGVEKLCLAGSDLADTSLYQEYLRHGKIWYVVFEVQKRGIVVGVTRNCVVTLFSKSSIDEFINYIMEDILPLVK
ncbi:MAG: hypothetical protein QW502_02385 [Candidatus Bathyarchaeia archaeon]|nr:hypothetical protein [Candidatus Bathyarchaeota archaeon]